MVALMEDLLTLAKVGQVERPAMPVDVNHVVQGVVEELGSRILDAGLTMKRESLPALQVTETLLAQIFNNLIGNAVRYAGREGGPIEIGGERSGKMVRFFVRDHGPGIPVEERSRIFEVFFRGATGKMVRGAADRQRAAGGDGVRRTGERTTPVQRRYSLVRGSARLQQA